MNVRPSRSTEIRSRKVCGPQKFSSNTSPGPQTYVSGSIACSIATLGAGGVARESLPKGSGRPWAEAMLAIATSATTDLATPDIAPENSTRGLLRALGEDHDDDGLQQDPDVEPQRPALGVLEVELDPPLE